MHPKAMMYVKWYAHPNDLIGGWSVMPVDHPPSCGMPEIGTFLSEEYAQHIASLHNQWLQERGR